MAIAKKTDKSPAAAATSAPSRAEAPKKVATKPAAKKKSARSDGDDEGGSGRSTSLGLDIDAEVLAFIEALDRFKKTNNRPFPSWSEVLFVLKELGYRKS